MLMLPNPHLFFADLLDPRRETHKKLHNLEDIVITLCAVLGGYVDWVSIEDFDDANEAWLRAFLELLYGNADLFLNLANDTRTQKSNRYCQRRIVKMKTSEPDPNQFCRSEIRQEKETNTARDIFGEDGTSRAMVEIDGSDRTALPQERQTRSSTDRTRAHAAHVLCAAMVWVGR